MSISITVSDVATDADRDAILDPLRAYNILQAGNPRILPVAILLTDADGKTVGGLWGKTSYDWLFVEFLAVPEDHRGQNLGTGLMKKAEKVARGHGCIGIWLDTYDFQARGFYEKLGFEVFGTLDDHPIGHQRFFLRRRF